MAEDGTMRLSLAGQLEAVITEYYYARGTSADARRRCFRAGLQTPLWLWTHEASTKEEMKEKELRKATHLVEWVLQQQIDPSKLAVLMPLEWRNDFRVMLSQQLQRQYRAHGSAVHAATPEPAILTHYELTAMQRRDKVLYHYDVVIYVFGLFPAFTSVAEARRQEENLNDALAAFTHAFVLCMDAGWMAPALRQQWPQWRSFHEKLADEQPFISVSGHDTEAERLPSLVGSSLPLCCSHHPEQRQLAHGVTAIVGQCKHLCLHPYDCGCAHHLCAAHCHSEARDHHRVCPYACEKPMACGHACLMACSARCNCYELVEAPLRCTHQEVIGLDKATMEPIYATVQHVFKGVCADKDMPCAVSYTTECMRCLGKLTVRCHEAQEQDHTVTHRTMVCDACKRTERELRASILGDVLCANEEEKKKLKVDMARTLHEQRKAASQGLFKPGTRVVIRDATRCVPPISAEDDFPGLTFVDMDDPRIFTELDGAYGTFVNSHVDVMDNSEVRNLVRLPDGRHVLVTDGGLDMIRALTSEVTGACQQRLLLTAAKNDDAANNQGETIASQAALSPEFAAARALVGQRMYVAKPIPCAAMEDGHLADKIVVVRDVDPTSPQNVLVDCALCTVPAANTAHPSVLAEAGETPGHKRQREEREPAFTLDDTSAEKENSPTHEPGAADATIMTVSCSAPISHLEEMSGLSAGHLVNVTGPERQVTDPRDLELLAAALLANSRVRASHAAPAPASAAHDGPVRIVATPINADTAYELVDIVNPPIHMLHRTGPCAILRTRPHAVKMVSPQAVRARGGRPRQTVRGPPVAPAAAHYLAVPFMFLAADELTEAERALDAAAQRQYERRVEDAIQQVSEDKALRNDEDAYHRQQQMPEVTPAILQQARVAYSVPTPPPTKAEIAEAKVRAAKLAVGSSTSARMMNLKDKLTSAQETKARGTYVQSIQDRLAKDGVITKVYLEQVNRRLQSQ